MPKGFLAKDGEHPEFENLYGMKQTSSNQYPPRTALNVKEADGTIRFARNWHTPGERLTLKLIQDYKKPYLDFNVQVMVIESLKEAIAWILYNNIQVLNVAGNSEDSAPGITLPVECFLTDLFSSLRAQTP